MMKRTRLHRQYNEKTRKRSSSLESYESQNDARLTFDDGRSTYHLAYKLDNIRASTHSPHSKTLT